MLDNKSLSSDNPVEESGGSCAGICYCGHDCSRCLTYLATVNDDEEMRIKAQAFYLKTFGFNIALKNIHCGGGRSEDVFIICHDCHWGKCCISKGISSCEQCLEYPCDELEEYTQRFVNKSNQVAIAE